MKVDVNASSENLQDKCHDKLQRAPVWTFKQLNANNLYFRLTDSLPEQYARFTNAWIADKQQLE